LKVFGTLVDGPVSIPGAGRVVPVMPASTLAHKAFSQTRRTALGLGLIVGSSARHEKRRDLHGTEGALKVELFLEWAHRGTLKSC
jgi:hypothetical protein